MAGSDPLEFAEPNDSLGDLAETLARDWTAVMAPAALAVAMWLGPQPSLAAALTKLPGLLTQLPTEQLRQRVAGATFQARLAGLLGVPISDTEARAQEELAFAEASGRVELRPLVDAEAVRYLSEKAVGQRFSYSWLDVREEEHVSSFVVAKAMNASLLGDIHQGLVAAIGQGWSKDRFVRELTPILQQAGWWGIRETTDPVTGETRLSQLGSPRRLKTIFDVNVRMAHAAGRWERYSRIAQPGDLLRYVAVQDERTREQHRHWHGTLLPLEHAFWDRYYPPNGWNCRCTVVLVSAGQATRKGWARTSEEELKRKGFGKTVERGNRRSGLVEKIPVGVDPGFAYNVGKARLRAFTPAPAGPPPAGGQIRQQLAHHRNLQSPRPELPPPRPFPGELPKTGTTPEEAEDKFLEIFEGLLQDAGGHTGVFFDQAQVPLVISRELFRSSTGAAKTAKGGRDRFLPVLAQTLIDPDEIWALLEERRDAKGKLIGVTWRRRYVGRWIIPGERQEAMLVVFEEDGATWSGVTAYPPAQSQSAGRQAKALDQQARSGVLIWRRER